MNKLWACYSRYVSTYKTLTSTYYSNIQVFILSLQKLTCDISICSLDTKVLYVDKNMASDAIY